MNDYQVADELLVPAVHAAVHPVVQQAQLEGPLPRLRSEEFLNAPPVVQRAVLLILGESWVLGDPARRLLRDAGRDVRAAADWPYLISGGNTSWKKHRGDKDETPKPAQAPYPGHVTFAELQRRRTA